MPNQPTRHCELVVMSTGEVLPLHDRCSIGRDPDNTILLDHRTVSRWHAVVVRASRSEYSLMDLGTKNGTYLNGAKLRGPVTLRSGNLITIEQEALKFRSKRERGRTKKPVIASTVSRDEQPDSPEDELFVPKTRGIVVLRGDLTVDAFSATAQLLLDQYLQVSIKKRRKMPKILDDWLRSNCEEIQEGINRPNTFPPFVKNQGENRFVVEAEFSIDCITTFLSLIEMEPLFSEEKVKREFAPKYGLTDRQAEVTFWVAMGKENREISTIIRCMYRTVGKHLERIFEKTGTENRKALTSLVSEFFHR